MGVKGEKYQRDASILLTFECNQKSKVDITATSLRHFNTMDYITENRENIYYLGTNPKTEEILLSPIINFDIVYINLFNIEGLLKNFLKNESIVLSSYK